MPSFIQISDTHIVPKAALAYGKSDTAPGLVAAVETINRTLPRLRDVSCVIITGDLTDHGTAEEYAHFLELLEEMPLPWMAIPGNHDRREEMRCAFAGMPWMPQKGPIQWLHDAGDYAIIGLDTLSEGDPYGLICAEGFAFLDETLTALGSKPVVVATHHPWLASGIPGMDANNLRNGADLLARLAEHPGPVRMTSGHVHRVITGVVNGIGCQIVPATCHSVAFDTDPDQPPQMAFEPGAITVFDWISEGNIGVISNTIPIGSYPGPVSFGD